MNFSDIKEQESKYSIHIAGMQNICMVHGKGIELYDTNDRRYLDFYACGGDNILGYGNKQLTEAVTIQSQKLINSSGNYYSNHKADVLQKLLNGTGFVKGAITNSAADAKLYALSVLKSYLKEKGDKRKNLVYAGNYTQKEGKANATFIELNNFDLLKKSLNSNTAALIIEPIAKNGIIFANYDYLVNAYALCKSLDITLICDETSLGLGRTGKMFAFESYGIQPDIAVCSKSLGGGFPLGAVLVRAGFEGNPHFLNQSYNLVALSCAEVVLDCLSQGLLEAAEEKGGYLLNELYKLSKYNFILDIRGRGLMAGIEFGKLSAAMIAGKMEKAGFLLGVNQEFNMIEVTPPLTVSVSEINLLCDQLLGLFASINI